MKFEITHSGAKKAEGKEFEIGEVVEFDTVPGFLLGKCRPVSSVKPDENAENAELKAELGKANAENAELKAEVEALELKVAELSKPVPAPKK